MEELVAILREIDETYNLSKDELFLILLRIKDTFYIAPDSSEVSGT